MKNKHAYICITAILVVMVFFLFYTNPWNTEQGDSFTATPIPTKTSTTTPTPTPEPTANTKAIIEELVVSLQGTTFPIPITEHFLQWLADSYGEPVLLALQESTLQAMPFPTERWYTLTGNSMFVLADLYTNAAEQQENVQFISAGQPNQERKTTIMTFGGDICFADNYVVMQHLKQSLLQR